MKKLLFVLVVVATVGAGAETTTYTWDGSTTVYGDQVTVAYDTEGKVTKLTSSVARGDKVVFVGGSTEFAADAVVSMESVGSLVFSNQVVMAGGVTVENEVVETVISGEDGSFIMGTSQVLPITFADFDELRISSATISWKSSGQLRDLPCNLYYERCEPSRYTVQAHHYGTQTQGAKIEMTPSAEGVVIKNVYVRQSNDSGNHEGEDFDAPTFPYSDTKVMFLTKVKIAVERNPLLRRMYFAGKLEAGGPITVSKGANVFATGAALGAVDGATCDLSVNFDNGAFSFLDCGSFSHTGSITGANGELAYVSSDRESVVMSTTGFEGPLTTEDQVVAHNASLASLSNVTAVVRWKYNTPPQDELMRAEYRGDLRAMMIRNFGYDTITRFQAVSQVRSMSFSTGVRFMQQGTDVVAKVVSCGYVWQKFQKPSADDPWIWDPKNDPGESPSQFSDKDPSLYTTVSNLTLTFVHPIGDINWNTDVTILTADSTSNVKYIFRPGANRRMLAVVKSASGMPQVGGEVHVYDRATLSLAYPDVSTGYNETIEGLWPGVKSSASSLYAHVGGRIVTNQLRQNSGREGQTVVIGGGEYYFRDPSDTSYAMQRGSSFTDYVRGVHYSNGAMSDGYAPYLGPQGGTATITVDGTAPSVCKNSYALYGSSSSPKNGVLDIADVTGDDGVDFTMEGHLFSIHYAQARAVKKGPGTVLFKKTHGLTWDKFQIQEGTVLLGIIANKRIYQANCELGTKGVSLEGGALAIQAGITNSISGPLALTADSTIRLAAGSKILVDDSSAEVWADGARLSITGDPETSAIGFGSTDGLTAAQLRRIRWNGKRVKLDENGDLEPYASGMAIIFR